MSSASSPLCDCRTHDACRAQDACHVLHELEPQHRHELEVESGIPSDLIAEEQIATLPDVTALEQLRPSETFRHPDAEKAARFGTLPNVKGGGIFYPIESWTEPGQFSWQFKSDRPRMRGGTPVKYESPPGARLTVYAPRRIRRQLTDATIPLWITEGIKKSLAAVGRGVTCIALAGVDAWSVRVGESLSSVIPEFAAIPVDGRLVFIAFDSDAIAKTAVQSAIDRLKHELEARGAHVLVVKIPPGPGGEKVGLDDFIAAGGDVNALAGAAMVDALTARSTPATPAAPVCDGSDERCPTSKRLRDQLHEHKVGDELIRHGPFTPDGALVVKHLVTVASAATDNGKEKLPLLREDVARGALGSDSPSNVKAVSRALKQYKAYQDDPALAATLPYKLEWRPGGRKTHIDLVPTRKIVERATEYMTLRQLPGRAPPARVLERDDTCPRCHSHHGLESRTTKRCLNDDCGHTWHGRPTIIGRQDVAMVERRKTDAPLVDIALPGQNVPAKSGLTYAGQNVPANGVSFVSHDEQLAAKPPAYSGQPDAEPEPPPPIHPPDMPPERICPEHALPKLKNGHGRCSLCPKPPKRPLVVHTIAPLSDRAWRRRPPTERAP